MRKWGAFVLFGALLVGLILYVVVFEGLIEKHDTVSPVTIEGIVEGILGDAPDDIEWSGEGHFGLDESVISEQAEEAITLAALDQPFPNRLSKVALELRLSLKSGYNKPSDNPARVSAASVAHIRALRVGDDPGEAASYAATLSIRSFENITTATTLSQWMDSQASRLVVISGLTRSLIHDGWDREELKELISTFPTGSNRAALGNVLHRRFLDVDNLLVVESSTESDPAKIVADALYEEPTDDEIKLINAVLYRHPKAFSPEATAESGAESLRQLKEAMNGPWSGCQSVLDEVEKLHSVWKDYQEVMQMGEDSASDAIVNLKLRLDKLENPVGMAVLHEERTSWSNLVQSAYVADAREAEFQVMLLKLAGLDDEAGKVIDPLTGKPFGEATPVVSDEYAFLKAYVEERQVP